MGKIGVESLKDVIIFEKPKYAFVYSKGDKDFYIKELWGVGSLNEYDETSESRCDKNFTGIDSTTRWFRFLDFNSGVLWPFDIEDFILLTELPSLEKINQMKDYINNNDRCMSCFTMDNYCNEIQSKDEK